MLALLPLPAAQADDAPGETDPAQRLLRFSGVEWRGVEGPLAENLRRKVSLARLKQGTGLRPARFDYFLRILPREVNEALEPFGYYSAALDIQPRRDEANLGALIVVTLGEPVRVRGFSLLIEGEGKDEPRLKQSLARFRPRQGDAFQHEPYEASKSELTRLLGELGFFDAALQTAQVSVTRADHAADIDLRWEGGRRYRFGEVEILGSHLREGLLGPLVPFSPDDPYEQKQLLALQGLLGELDYFRRVDIQPRPRETSDDEPPSDEAAAPSIGVQVELEPALRNVYRGGLSYGTDTGAAVKLGYTRRWVNTRGHKLEGDALIGAQRSVANLRYRIPAFERWTGWWTVNLAVRDEEFASLRSDIAELSLAREGSWRGNRISVGLFAQREQFSGFGETLLYPQVSVERTVSNDALYPTRGFRWKLLGRWGSEALGSDLDFRQLIASASFVRGFGDTNRLILRAEAGATRSAQFERLPPSLRFYAGGDRSVRGYGYQELGPVFEGDIPVGGRNLLVGSAEWERMFTEQWGGALFVDAGNAYGKDFKAATGVGIGLRWRSPVGPVRLDIGRGLDNPGQSFRLHLQLGPEL